MAIINGFIVFREFKSCSACGGDADLDIGRCDCAESEDSFAFRVEDVESIVEGHHCSANSAHCFIFIKCGRYNGAARGTLHDLLKSQYSEKLL